jgi:hypothetical protein
MVSTRPGILRSRRILNHAKPSITAGGMKRRFQDIITGSLIIPLVKGLYLNVGTIKTSFQTEKVNDVANALILEMSKRLITYESKKCLQIATLLDPRFKTNGFRSREHSLQAQVGVQELLKKLMESSETEPEPTYGSKFF